MMSITKRIFALLLTVALLVSVFCACNKQKEPDGTSGSTTPESAATTPNETTPEQTTPEVPPTVDPPTTPPQKITSVHITCGSSAIESYAAAELTWYFAKKNVTLSSEGFGIELKIDADLAPKDGYSITADEEGLVLAAGNERGLAYGLYAFLEKFLGVHVYSPDTIVVDDGDVMIGGGVLAVYEPAFEIIRNPWFPIKSLAEKDGGNVHDLDSVKTLALNAIVGGGNIQPCLTNPENLTKAIGVVKNYLRAVKNVDTLCFAPATEYDLYCECDSCAAVIAEEGSPAGIYVRFLNQLTEAVSAEYPALEYALSIRAYLKTAPSVTKLSDKISLRFDMSKCHISHPITDASCPDSAALADSMRSWGKMGANIHVEYGLTATKDFIPVFANFGSLRENFRFFAECGVDSIICDGNIVCPTGEFGELRVYLVSQLLQNPMMSEEEYYGYMDAFLKAYYGEGWMHIREFIDLIIELSADGHQTADGSPFDAITKEEYEEHAAAIEAMWDKAQALASDFANDREAYVKRARFQWRYIKLCLNPNAEDAQALITDAASNPRVGWRPAQWNVDVEGSDLNLAPTEWAYNP